MSVQSEAHYEPGRARIGRLGAAINTWFRRAEEQLASGKDLELLRFNSELLADVAQRRSTEPNSLGSERSDAGVWRAAATRVQELHSRLGEP